MESLKAAAVCVALLYAIDAYWCNGLYFAAAHQMVEQAFAFIW
jgi:hypothetical protein